MKLYRGIISHEYGEYTGEVEECVKSMWKKALSRRTQGDLSYPDDLNDMIIELHKQQSLTRQYFTDNKVIAERYISAKGGVLIEIDVPIEDIVDHFLIEFQNYSKRKESFEIVYMVHGALLSKNKKLWKMKVLR